MESSAQAAARVQQIEAEQDEVLRQLEELELRTQQALAEHAPPRGSAAGDGEAPQPES